MAAAPRPGHPALVPETIPVVVAPPTRKVQDAQRHPRLARELATIRAMVAIFCHDHHATHGDALCAPCGELMAYATRRLDRCVFGDDKPTCANCKVHCYTADMREQVRVVMRYAGPRMLRRHPLLALHHVIDGRREAPDLPAPASRRTRSPSP
jgi:hypothetical protein